MDKAKRKKLEDAGWVIGSTADFLGDLNIVTAVPAVLEGNVASGTRSVNLPQTALVGVRVMVDAAVFEGL